jgi:hypothetical protein
VELTGTNKPITCHAFHSLVWVWLDGLWVLLRPLYGSREATGLLWAPCVGVWGVVGCVLDGVSAVIAAGERPVPFRTRKLSLSAPMVLPG